MSAATAMIASEARLLVRNPGVVLWTVILPVAAAIVIASIPAARKPVGSFGGLSTFQVYQPILVLFVLSMLAVQALPDVLTRYREMVVLKRLRTTPVSPFLLLTAQFVLIMGVSLVCLALIVVIPGIISGQWPHHLFGFVVSYLLSCWAFLGLGMVIASLFRNAKVAVDAGADGYLLKATPRADLIAAVRRAAAGQSVLDPSAAASLMSRNRFEALTERECEVLRAVAGGGTNRQVAAELMISEATVKTHLLRLYPKLGVKDRAAAVRVAFERGLIR